LHGGVVHRFTVLQLALTKITPKSCASQSSDTRPTAIGSVTISSSTRSPTSLLYLRATVEAFKLDLISDFPFGFRQRFLSHQSHRPVISFEIVPTTFQALYF
jgi:hypothetical protein